MAGRFTVGIFGRGTQVHAACFEDHAVALASALRDCGHATVDFDDPAGMGRLIMYGAQNISADPNDEMPRDAILFNTEQLGAVEDPRSLMGAWDRFAMHRRVVWDYSEANIAAMRGLGLPRVAHCPVGYHTRMTKQWRKATQDVDVLFYGSMCARRREVLDELNKAGLQVKHLFGVYGAERDEWIARSKVVLNLHFYDEGVFEIFRVSHLLANRKCVVTEGGGRDAALEDLARDTCLYVPEKGEERVKALRRACEMAVADAGLRRMHEERGFETFAKTSLAVSVARALEQS